MNSFPSMGFNIMSTIFPILFFIVFLTIIITIIMQLVGKGKEYRRNNKSPILNVEAEVIAKRFDTRRHRHNSTENNMMNTYSSYNLYYITFQVESGDRMEFEVNGQEYGMLIEHDKGKLKFQGTRYLGFERNV